MDSREDDKRREEDKKRQTNRRRFLATAGGIVAGGGVLAALTGGGCGGKKDASKTIKIFSSMPRTGSAKGQTDTIVNGIRMAIEEYNSEVAGFKIEYTDLDDANATQGNWTAELETANAQKAEADPDCMAMIGPYNSGAASLSAPILNMAGVVQVSPAVTWPGLTKPGYKAGEPGVYQKSGVKTFCRVIPTDEIQSLVGAAFIRDTLKKKRVYVLDDRQVYGKGVADLFEIVVKQFISELEVVGRDGINPEATDYKPLMRNLANKFKPEVVYFGGTSQTNAGQVAKDLKEAIPGCALVVPDGCYEQAFIKAAGADALNGLAYVTFGGADPSKLTGPGKTFVDNYTKKYGGMPEGYAIYGYECGKVVMEAIKKAGKKDREAIRAAVFATKDFSVGALGKWGFDDNGDTTQANFTVSAVKDGNFSVAKEYAGDDIANLQKKKA